MACFSAADLEALDQLWRGLPGDHVWTGWSASGDTPAEIVLYRTRAHWRKFPLRKTGDGFTIFNDKDQPVAKAATLDELIIRVEAIPGLVEETA